MGRSISKTLRFEVFKRDRFTCVYCGRKPPSVVLQVDHIKAVSRGGGDDMLNLATCCFDCNAGKSDRDLSDIVRDNSDEIAIRKERLKQTKEYSRLLDAERKYDLQCIGRLENYWRIQIAARDDFCFNAMHTRSIRIFLKRLSVVELEEAIECAGAAKISGRIERSHFSVWSYFCGICWNSIKRQTGESKCDYQEEKYGE